MSFSNKTIIVTGAGGGMGKATVELLLKENANVVGCDLHIDSLVAFEDQSQFLSFEGNLLNENNVKDIFEKTVQTFGQIDGLVNIAGVAQSATPIEEISLDEWHKIMDMNMTMTFLTCREAAIYMKKRQQGAIVNIGSVSTTRPRPGLQAYVGSKGAVESFTKALALELSPDHIKVNVLHPGPADTEMLGQFTKQGENVNDTKKAVFESSVPLGKLLQPTDIAQSIKFLLSDEANMITGSVLHVDGGRSI
ncbi:3-oxoacyl-[acyl-carrier protein] reductase [Virgibacillus natechei]|uniref:3-oxoacyl-[acyl-carrier protein] reductase n=1 Tax=Virgibacillus natechei TaxID=1216297 RepID=A0ABS4IGI3_9BACI|nr:SDR family oxidoreductase [Virgibacillus natechei]MBP1970047.1 3-oxoacyl-[acyl-carrier protein] reductase [Virgibacillus natechei]UZD14132.1 SDR family oxidoreductase [Virgibacillus natechei]